MNFNLNFTRFTAPALNSVYRMLVHAACAYFCRSVKVIAGAVSAHAVGTNGWRYGVGLPCRLFHFTATITGKLHYTACYQLARIINYKLN